MKWRWQDLTAGKLTLNEEQEVEIAVSAYEASLNLQIWKNYVDEIGVSVIHPGNWNVKGMRVWISED